MFVAELPDTHGHAKGEHRAFALERPIPYTPRMLFLWFYQAARHGFPRRLLVCDHVNYLTPACPTAVATARRALELARGGDVEAAAKLAGVTLAQATVVSQALRDGMRFSIGVETDNDPRLLPETPGIVEAMRPDWIVRSVHFIPIRTESGASWQWPFDNPEFAHVYERVGTEATWELYTATLFGDLAGKPADVVAHFYVPAKFGHWPKQSILERYEDRLLEICRRREIAVELNTRPLYRETSPAQTNAYLAANQRLLCKAKAQRVRVALGSDAHAPADQGGAFETARELLDCAKIGEVAFPT
jgi:HisJ family histidinol phosphate phosphatase